MTAAVESRKLRGAYYTPPAVARALVTWVVRSAADRLLDPSCGDGRFLEHHLNSVGVELDPHAAGLASEQIGRRLIHVEDFFAWAERTTARFDCAAGNPPFIRYQRFTGETRQRARRLGQRVGMDLSGLSSSWLPFVVGTTVLLKAGGRMAFVVPAEIGHATYAARLLKFLASQFGDVRIVALCERLFPELSQDAWLLYAADRGATTEHVSFAVVDAFKPSARPPRGVPISLRELEHWRYRLRPFLLSSDQRACYRQLQAQGRSVALGELARVGIGYVSGGNEFFHLRPSDAERLGIPRRCLTPAVRTSRWLTERRIEVSTVADWLRRDEACLLLKLRANEPLPDAVQSYLDSAEGRVVREGYKCRHRSPWYVVPDVRTPHAFLSYMIGERASFSLNKAKCTASNSVHAVEFLQGDGTDVAAHWDHPLVDLSCELEGHPLGGGMLKLEPREASRVRIPTDRTRLARSELELLTSSTSLLRSWRHYA